MSTTMKLPMARMPAAISESVAAVLHVHGLSLSPELLREVGKNATQALFDLDEPPMRYELGYGAVTALRRCCPAQGAGASLRAIDRLQNGEADAIDIERLAPLAKLAGLPWAELFPDVPCSMAPSSQPPTADLLVVGETLRALAAAGRPNADTAAVLARVGEWLADAARAELAKGKAA